MKKQELLFLMATVFVPSQMLLAKDKGLDTPTHKFWSCTITSYNSTVDSKYHEDRCMANTQYSEPPCKEFFVEYEGVDGIRPGVPYKQAIGQKSASTRNNENDATTKSTTIEIRKDKDQYSYTHTIVEMGNTSTNKWAYNGKCVYFEDPRNEKIYMQKDLDTTR